MFSTKRGEGDIYVKFLGLIVVIGNNIYLLMSERFENIEITKEGKEFNPFDII